ncbi:MAG: hypothetical protein ACMUIP_15880 [bacterium]
MVKKLLWNITLIIVLVIMLDVSVHAVPGEISLQGKVTYKSGEALNGNYQLEFLLYDQETGGNILWQELHDDVEIVGGIYNIQLGSVDPSGNPLDVNYFINNSELYLEMVITDNNGGIPEAFPRQRLTSTAFAMKAADADTAGSINWTGIVNPPAGLDDGDDVIDDDADPSNEIQTLGTSGNEITLTDGGSVTAPYAHEAGNANTLGGMDSGEFGDGHSLDAADSDPMDAIYVNNEGNVGIGTTEPLMKLHIADNGELPFLVTYSSNRTDWNSGIRGVKYRNDDPTNNNYTALALEGVTTNGGTGVFGMIAAVMTDHTASSHDGDLAFIVRKNSALSEVLRIKSTGNVGIGTASPTQDLHIHRENERCLLLLSSTSNHSGIQLDSGVFGTKSWLILGDNDPAGLKFINETDHEIEMIIANSGNIGIGTTEPKTELHIEGTAGPTNLFIETHDTGNEMGAWIGYGGNDPKNGWYNGCRNTDKFEIGHYIGEENWKDDWSKPLWSKDIVIDSSGNVGIGTTSPEGQFHLKGTDVTPNPGWWDNDMLLIEHEYDVGMQFFTSDTKKGYIGFTDPQMRNAGLISYDHNNNSMSLSTFSNERVRIDGSGNVGIGTTSPETKLDVEGTVQAHAFDTGDIVFRKDGEKLWRMFEDEKGLYLESYKTGEASRIFLEKDIEELKVENESLRQEIEQIKAVIGL